MKNKNIYISFIYSPVLKMPHRKFKLMNIFTIIKITRIQFYFCVICYKRKEITEHIKYYIQSLCTKFELYLRNIMK